MKPFRNDGELADALREIRPTPRPEFAAELDGRAAAGFPGDSRWASAIARARRRLASTPPRRLIAPAGAFAVAAVVIATAVVAATENDDPTSAVGPAATTLDSGHAVPKPAVTAPAAGGSGGAAGESANGTFEAPSTGIQSEAKAPTSASGYATVVPDRGSGPYAAHAEHRDVERSAEIVLGAEPSEVRTDAAKVFDAVHAANGIVLSSSIRDGDAGDAGADFELLIPSAKVGDAMASFSSIAPVRSRHEATQDITAPTVSVGEKLRDARASVESLLGQLADATTGQERSAVEAQLRSERYRVASLRTRLSSLSRRANFSHVTLRIETGATSSSGEEGAGGGWGIGDGLHGAGRILAVAAGVTVIGLAILAPFALIALLAWLCRRGWLRRARRDTLSRT